MQDGMSREHLNVAHFATSGSITAEAISGNTLAVSAAQIDATELAADSVAASEISAGAVGTDEQGFVGTGSPITYGTRVLHGSATIPSATSAWVVFGDVFQDCPNIGLATSKGGDVDIFSVNPGSFLASGTSATVVHWFAAGSA